MKLFYALLLSLSMLSQGCFADVALRQNMAAKNKVLNTRPNGSSYAGVLPVYYHPKHKKHYVLLSREAYNGSKDRPKGTYCDFGGSVDFDQRARRYHRFVTGALNELYEESSGLYNFRGPKGENFIKTQSQLYYDLNRPFKKVMAFLPLKYIKRANLLRQRNHLKRKHANHHMYEKDDFLWVEARSLLQATQNLRPRFQHTSVKVKVLEDNGRISWKIIPLRGTFVSSLAGSGQILATFK